MSMPEASPAVLPADDSGPLAAERRALVVDALVREAAPVPASMPSRALV